MKRINILLLLLAFCFATGVQAQTPDPKPDPQLKKLHVFVGHWTFEGENHAGPLGPAGKVTGELTTHMILHGFFFEATETTKEPDGSLLRVVEIDGYDAVNKTFASHVFFSDGSALSGVVGINNDNDTYTWRGKIAAQGKLYQLRDTWVLRPNSMKSMAKVDISADGKTWTPLLDRIFTKTKPAAKK